MKEHAAKIPTPTSLRNAALFYLSRYAASSGTLRRVLQNRIRRAALRNSAFAADHAAQTALQAAIDTIIADLSKQNILQDETYASMKAASWRRSGLSQQRIKQKLHLQGITTAQAARALAAIDADADDADLLAARRLAKRKRLGPFRARPADLAQQRKDIAALARAGFSLTIARQVIGAALDDEMDVA